MGPRREFNRDNNQLFFETNPQMLESLSSIHFNKDIKIRSGGRDCIFDGLSRYSNGSPIVQLIRFFYQFDG